VLVHDYESGERRLLACSGRQLAGHTQRRKSLSRNHDKTHLGKLPRWAGWQPALPKTGILERRAFLRHIELSAKRVPRFLE
jgi:hypothetical protein